MAINNFDPLKYGATKVESFDPISNGATKVEIDNPLPQQSISEKIWGGLASGLDTIFGSGNIGKTIGTKIGYAMASPEEKKFYDQSTPSLGENIGSALQSASLFIPGGKVASGISNLVAKTGLKTGVSAIGKIGAGALAGEAFDVSSNLQQGKTGTDIVTPGFGTAVGAAIPAAGVAKNVLVRFGENQAPRVVNSLIKPLAKDFSYGKNPGRAIAESGIVANNFEDLVTKIKEVRQKTGQSIGDLGDKLSTKPVINVESSLSPINEAMKTAASQNNSSLLKRLSDVKTAITSILEPGVDDAGNIIIKEKGKRNLKGLTFSQAREILGQVGDITQFTGNPSDDKIVNSALKRVYGSIKDKSLTAADEINPSLSKEFKKLTERYADLSSAEIATKYRDKIVERSNLVGLSPQVAGIGTGLITMIATGGAATPAILAGLTGATIDKLASTPGFKTRLAALLSKKTPEEIGYLYKKVPALQKFLPKGSISNSATKLLQSSQVKKE